MALYDRSIGVVAPYFGHLPNMFDLWLKSASFNPSVDFHLVGDCFDGLPLPENVFVHPLSFEALQVQIGSRLGARPLKAPYKLCDFKPSYRVLFADILEGYDIWGFSDLDVVYGDLQGTIAFGELNPNWGRVFDFGHLSFFPNDPEVSMAFADTFDGVDAWSFVKNSRLIFVYDEHYYSGFGGVNGRLEDAGWRIEPCLEAVSDVLPNYRGLFDTRRGPLTNLAYLWESGKLLELRAAPAKSREIELSYVHFQKRKAGVHWLDDHRALLTPSYWDAPRSIDEAITMLDTYAPEDGTLRPDYSVPRRGFAQTKSLNFLIEAMSLPGGLAALKLYLRNRKRGR